MKSLKLTILMCALLVNAQVMMAAEPAPETGTVAETIEVGTYVYLRLEEQGKWIATPLFAVVKGDRVQYDGGMEMRDFYSKTLDRTFESVYFIQNVRLVGQDGDMMHAAAMEGHAGKDMQMPKPASVAAPAAGDIKPLSEGKTVADIFAESARLNEQTVSLNARVMKVSKDILGKNWVTLQDGTGTQPDNKLLVTSAELVSPGDLVIAKGIVRTDIDIGSGYKYKVLLQEATFSPGFE